MTLSCHRLCTLALPLILASAAHASYFYTWQGTVNGNLNVKGSVDFAVVADGGGYDLVITLKNTSLEMQEESSAVISGLFFNVKVNGVDPGPLSMKAAVAPEGLISAVGTVADPSSQGSNICGLNTNNPSYESCVSPFQGGWQFNYNATDFHSTNANIPVGTQFAIGTAGLGGVFKGQDVNGPGGNFDYAIVDNVGAGNGGFSSYPYTLNTGVFTLTGLSSDNIELSSVLAAYGTAPEGVLSTTQENPETPEPGTLASIAGGMVLLAWRRRARASA